MLPCPVFISPSPFHLSLSHRTPSGQPLLLLQQPQSISSVILSPSPLFLAFPWLLLQSEVFNESWMVDFSDEYAPSILFESGSEFSENSITDDKIPSPTFSLFLQYSQKFCRSTSDSLRSNSDGKNSEEFACLKFEDEENEESYRMLRNRERRQVYFHYYEEEYGELVIQQRPQMVHWIVEEYLTVFECLRSMRESEFYLITPKFI